MPDYKTITYTFFVGLDFNSSSQFVTLDRTTTSVTLRINIVQDDISEHEEVFLLLLRDATQPAADGSRIPVTLERDVTTVVIGQSGT